MNLLTKPSFLSHVCNGILILIVLWILMKNYLLGDKILRTEDLLNILLLLSITIGIHGLMHLGLEINYKFNPLENIN